MKDLFEVLKPGSKDWILANSIDPTRLPTHIAIIMDGNGRWARRRNLPRVAGHKAGMDPVRDTVESCTRLGIQALTLYAFSTENWKRPRAEVDMLWRLLRLYLSRELPDLLRTEFGSAAWAVSISFPRQCARSWKQPLRPPRTTPACG